MKIMLIVVCLLGIVQASKLSTGIGQNCNISLNLYQVSSFVVTPWPPNRNNNLSMTMTGVMAQAETLKTMEIFVFFNGSSFYHESIAETGTYTAGQIATVNFMVYLPSIAPSGNYQVQVKLTNTSGAYLNCWQVSFTLS